MARGLYLSTNGSSAVAGYALLAYANFVFLVWFGFPWLYAHTVTKPYTHGTVAPGLNSGHQPLLYDLASSLNLPEPQFPHL